MTATQTEFLVKVLSSARAEGSPANLALNDLPKSLAEAYAISFAQMTEVAAWKIGGANPWSRDFFENSENFFGPLRPAEVFLRGPTVSLKGLNAPLAEPEIMLELASSGAHDQKLGFSRMAIGFEVPASVLPDDLKPVLIGQVVDRAGAGVLWIADVRPFDRAILEMDFSSRVVFNDDKVSLGHSSNVLGGPVGAAEDFLQLAVLQGAPLSAGQWIATGGLSPAVPVSPGDCLRVSALHWDVQVCFE